MTAPVETGTRPEPCGCGRRGHLEHRGVTCPEYVAAFRAALEDDAADLGDLDALGTDEAG